MDQQTHVSDEEIMESWYSFVATEPGFVGMLKLLRDRDGTTREQQQKVFGVNDQEFRRLEAMPMPRPKSLAGTRIELQRSAILQTHSLLSRP